MPKRSLREARLALEEDILPRANDYVRRTFTEALTAAEDRAKALANTHAQQQAESIAEAIKATQGELTEVRDAYESLASDANALMPDEYAIRLRELRDRETIANTDLKALQQRIDAVAQIEDDPIAFFDRVTPPIAKETFPW